MYTLLAELAVELTICRSPTQVAGAGRNVVADCTKELPESDAAGRYTDTEFAKVVSSDIYVWVVQYAVHQFLIPP